ncbi:MAG: YjbQ family protein [Saprospiraceae bacterium]|nr:YjbQ family protein [Saprospiraceae bacterium]
MEIITHSIYLRTQGHNEIHNFTPQILQLLQESSLKDGQVTVFAIGSTTGITTLEYEPGLVKKDVRVMLDKIAPYEKSYLHNQTWGDNNGAAHLRSCLIGTSYVCPFVDGQMLLGTWQQIVFIDFDTRPRQRNIAVQFIGLSDS